MKREVEVWTDASVRRQANKIYWCGVLKHKERPDLEIVAGFKEVSPIHLFPDYAELYAVIQVLSRINKPSIVILEVDNSNIINIQERMDDVNYSVPAPLKRLYKSLQGLLDKHEVHVRVVKSKSKLNNLRADAVCWALGKIDVSEDFRAFNKQIGFEKPEE